MSATVDLAPFNSIIARLEAVTAKLEQGAASGAGAATSSASAGVGASAGDGKLAASLDTYMKSVLPALEAAAKDSGVADLAGATETVMKTFQMLKDGMNATAVAAKPKDQDWGKILAPVSAMSGEANKACDNRSEYFQSRKSAAETINLVALLAQPAPASHVTGVFETVDFHVTKALQKKNPPEVAWVKALKEVLKGLSSWCNEECKMGLTWKHGGQDAVGYFAANPLGGGAGAAPAAA
eukprot:CAMPEP_0204239040 /NCGR_PEP_ID=MMETSP0361-20130328/94176_1 /ASSEMBLY_ACC=CAM_ASM_000343 /TAXON_ID=268821 /ORGANISM="Scrippsiella Hangoei, Strain SHTV-5" /LENGTH=238 /DNA_ID=CAMNT_0051211827 /DNA_START=57 /DNA_END=769 /DNA_ORIENTATION=-